MLNKRKRWTSLLVALGGFTLLTFQNCAPSDTGTTANYDGEVRIVDRWAQSKVQFMAASYLVDPNVDSVNIKGFCDNSSDAIQWEAVQSASLGEVILSEGEVYCENGSFRVEVAVSNEQLASCSDILEVRASVSDAEALTQLRLACL